MSEIYKNIKTGVKAELVEINEKSKQVTLKKLSDGKPTSTLMGSFEKYWKKIDENGKPVKEAKSEAPKKEEVAKAEKPVEDPKPEVEKKPAKTAKVEKPKKEKKERKPVGLSEDERTKIKEELLKAFDKMKLDVSVPANYPLWINIKIGEKNAFGIGLGATHIRVRTIKELMPKGTNFSEVKGGMSATVIVTYEDKQGVIDLVKYVNDTFKDSDVLKKHRKEKSVKAEKKEPKNSKKD